MSGRIITEACIKDAVMCLSRDVLGQAESYEELEEDGALSGLKAMLDQIVNALHPNGVLVADDVRVVFDGPPGPTCGRFVECETSDGASVRAGDWHEREDGLWELRMLACLKDGKEPKP